MTNVIRQSAEPASGWGNRVVVADLLQRTTANFAGFFLPHLRPGIRLLDCGCGPDSILAAGFGAIPHWGQLHDPSTDFAPLFGARLEDWRSAMNRLSREGGGRLNTFRHGFALRRRLLTALF